MADLTFASGFDAWVRLSKPDDGVTGGNTIRLQAAQRRGIVKIPMTGIRGRTVLTATLIGHVRDGWAAQTLTAKLLATGIDPAKVTWNNLPATVAGLSGEITTGALTGGATVGIPVGVLVQAIADGAKNHGFLITTDATAANTANLRSFTSGQASWTLEVVLSDVPDKPTDLRPNDGAVSSGAPKLAFDGGALAWSQVQVQVDPAANWTSPAYDSGTVASSDSVYDLSTAAGYTAISSGATTQWRVRINNGITWGPWSDAASFTYTPKPSLVVDSPTGGVIGDPTFAVLAHLGSGTLRRYRVRISRGSDRTNIKYDTGHVPPDGTTIARGIPWRDPDDHRRIIRGDDTNWQINIRAWDAVDRAEAVGDPTYVETWVSVTFDTGANETPADYTVVPVSPGDPRMVHTWTRSVSADRWLIMTSHGEIVHKLDPDDVTADAGTYTFTDSGETQPYVPTVYKVRAVDAGDRSPASNTVTITSTPGGMWLIREDGGAVHVFDGDGIDTFTKDYKADTYTPVNVDTDVDIVYGYPGIRGTYTGELNNQNSADVLAAIDDLEDLRRTPTERPRLIWASQSIRAQVKNPFAVPDPEITPANMAHTVTFAFIEDPD